MTSIVAFKMAKTLMTYGDLIQFFFFFYYIFFLFKWQTRATPTHGKIRVYYIHLYVYIFCMMPVPEMMKKKDQKCVEQGNGRSNLCGWINEKVPFISLKNMKMLWKRLKYKKKKKLHPARRVIKKMRSISQRTIDALRNYLWL